MAVERTRAELEREVDLIHEGHVSDPDGEREREILALLEEMDLDERLILKGQQIAVLNADAPALAPVGYKVPLPGLERVTWHRKDDAVTDSRRLCIQRGVPYAEPVPVHRRK